MRTGIRPRTAPYGRTYPYKPRRKIPWAQVIEVIGGGLVLALWCVLIWIWILIGAPA